MSRHSILSLHKIIIINNNNKQSLLMIINGHFKTQPR